MMNKTLRKNYSRNNKKSKKNTKKNKINIMKGGIREGLQNYITRLTNNDPELTKLDIRFKNIDYEDATALSTVLKDNTTLTELDISGNYFGVEGAKALIEALKVNRTLTKLVLSYNHIRDAGVIAFAEVLKDNTTLKVFDISNNEIGNDGAIAFAETLKINTSLEKLNISSNIIEKTGAIALAAALKLNTSLKFIIINNNKFGIEGAIAFAEALKINTSLEKINISGNNFGIEGENALKEAINYKKIKKKFTPILEPYILKDENDKNDLEENIDFIKQKIKFVNLPNNNNDTKQIEFDNQITKLTNSYDYFNTLIQNNYINGMSSIKNINTSKKIIIDLHGSIINNIFKLPDNINIVFLSPIDYMTCANNKENKIKDKLKLNLSKYLSNPFCFNDPEIINIFKEAVIYYGGQYCIDLNLSRGDSTNHVTGIHSIDTSMFFNKSRKYNKDSYRTTLSLMLKDDFNKEDVYTICLTSCRGIYDKSYKILLKFYEQTIKILNFKINYDNDDNKSKNDIHILHNKCKDISSFPTLTKRNVSHVQFTNYNKHKNTNVYVTSRNSRPLNKNTKINNTTTLETLSNEIKLINEINKYDIFEKIFNKLHIYIEIYEDKFLLTIEHKNISQIINFLFKHNYDLMFEYLVYCQLNATILSKNIKKQHYNNVYFLEYCINNKEFNKLKNINISSINYRLNLAILVLITKHFDSNKITTINISNDNTGADVGKNAIIILKSFKSLTTFNISDNNINDQNAIFIGDTLINNSTLTSLDIHNNKIGNRGAKALSEVLKNNNTLKTLDISGNDIGNEGANALAEALKLNTSLKTLNISNNKLNNDSIKALQTISKVNNILITIDINKNEFVLSRAISSLFKK